MSYQDDVAERRGLLDAWLRDTAADLAGAHQALHQLTLLDGPQPPEVSAGIAAALNALTTARRALDRDALAAVRLRISA